MIRQVGQNGTPAFGGDLIMVSSVVVARTKSDGLEYLAEAAPVAWTDVSDLAQHFHSVRDATRAAMRLPSRFRAFAMPVSEAS